MPARVDEVHTGSLGDASHSDRHALMSMMTRPRRWRADARARVLGHLKRILTDRVSDFERDPA